MFGLFPVFLAKALRVFTTSCAAKSSVFWRRTSAADSGTAITRLLVLSRHAQQMDLGGHDIEQFSTTMVGEFFDLARRHSLLAQSMEDDPTSAGDPQAKTEAFSRGLANAQLSGGLLHHVFSVRTPATDQSPQTKRSEKTTFLASSLGMMY